MSCILGVSDGLLQRAQAISLEYLCCSYPTMFVLPDLSLRTMFTGIMCKHLDRSIFIYTHIDRSRHIYTTQHIKYASYAHVNWQIRNPANQWRARPAHGTIIGHYLPFLAKSSALAIICRNH